MEERITQSLPALTIIEYDINFTLYKRGVYGSDRWNIDSTNHQNNRLIFDAYNGWWWWLSQEHNSSNSINGIKAFALVLCVGVCVCVSLSACIVYTIRQMSGSFSKYVLNGNHSNANRWQTYGSGKPYYMYVWQRINMVNEHYTSNTRVYSI